jgi:hypothetical protein
MMIPNSLSFTHQRRNNYINLITLMQFSASGGLMVQALGYVRALRWTRASIALFSTGILPCRIMYFTAIAWIPSYLALQRFSQ